MDLRNALRRLRSLPDGTPYRAKDRLDGPLLTSDLVRHRCLPWPGRAPGQGSGVLVNNAGVGRRRGGLSETIPVVAPMAEDAPVREALMAGMKNAPFVTGDAATTADALLAIVDTPNPPLRVLFGTCGIEPRGRSLAVPRESL